MAKSPFGSLIGCVGGRGLFWNGAAPRFNAADFEGWPISIGDLEPHYAWAEQQFRVTTAYGGGRLGQEVIRRLQAAGIDAQAGPYAVDCHAAANGWLAGTAGNSLAPLLCSTMLTTAPQQLSLSVRAFARRIIIDGGVAQGVEALDLVDGSIHPVMARSIVHAASAFESVRLAIASGVPDPHGVVGRYITDHMFVRAYYPVEDGLYDPQRPEVAIVWVPAAPGDNHQIEIHLPSDNLFMLQETTSWRPGASRSYSAMVRSRADAAAGRELCGGAARRRTWQLSGASEP